MAIRDADDRSMDEETARLHETDPITTLVGLSSVIRHTCRLACEKVFLYH